MNLLNVFWISGSKILKTNMTLMGPELQVNIFNVFFENKFPRKWLSANIASNRKAFLVNWLYMVIQIGFCIKRFFTNLALGFFDILVNILDMSIQTTPFVESPMTSFALVSSLIEMDMSHMFVELRSDCKLFVARATLNLFFFVVISNGVPFQFCQSVESFVTLFAMVISNLQVDTFEVHFEFRLGKKCGSIEKWNNTQCWR